MTIYTVAIGKGGAGKSATAAEVACALAGRGRKVLACDLDRQGNMTTRLGVTRASDLAAVAADVITGDYSPAEAAAPSPLIEGVYVLAGTKDLPDLELRPELMHSLPAALREETDQFDDVVIDTPSHQGLITIMGLAAADRVIAPCACTGESYLELLKLADTIESKVSKPRLKRGQEIHWVVPTQVHARASVDRQIMERMQARFGDRVTHPIRNASVVGASFLAARPVSLYERRHAVVADYAAALDQIITEEM